jgi:fructose-bisphosphate aldolase class II/tagatose 1,6-diphosphate aldolase GatY/KbaY
MLARGADIVRDAWLEQRAVAAFTIYTIESVRGVCEAAVAARRPVILQAGSSSFGAVGRTTLAAAALAAASDSPELIGVHLDHSTDAAEIRACIDLGYSSVMFDGSHLPFEENVARTLAVVTEAHAAGVWVEAELGAIGGGEDASSDAVADELTAPAGAEAFAARTRVDALAVAIGSVHGMTAHPVHLDLVRLAEIAARVPIPLVLHGASGLDEDELRQAVHGGMAKVNFNAELRRSYLDALRQGLEGTGDDLVVLQRQAIAALAATAEEKIRLVGGATPPAAGDVAHEAPGQGR